MTRYKLLGVNVDWVEEENVNDLILQISSEDKPSQVILLDTFLLMKAKFNKELKNIINSADVVIPISSGIINGLKFFKYEVGKKYNFFNFIIRLLTHFTDFKKNVYILGGNSEKIIKRADLNIKGSFPGIRLMGSYHFKYKKSFEKNLILAIQKTSPSLVIVSNHRPKQERWIYNKKKSFKSGVFIGVENFVNIIGAKEPTEKKIKYGSHRMSIIFKNPLRIFYYISFVFLLLIYKIFKIDKPTV